MSARAHRDPECLGAGTPPSTGARTSMPRTVQARGSLPKTAPLSTPPAMRRLDTMIKTLKASAMALALAPARASSVTQTLASRFTRRAARLDTLAKRMFALAAMTLIASPAHAATAAGGGGDITAFFQNIVNVITGTFGQLVAVIAVVGVGIGALMGAFSLRAVGGVLLGVMLIFSASWIVQQITA